MYIFIKSILSEVQSKFEKITTCDILNIKYINQHTRKVQ